MNKIMDCNGFFCTFNMPPALKGDNINCLPPYNEVPAYNVDEYPACPDNWMNGSTLAKSYFVPVKSGKGIWLDFNENNKNKKDVAVVISIQGINPITGQKTNNLKLEKYNDKCPIHDKPFLSDRLCLDCNFKWPKQNYISNCDRDGSFWIDGFRSQDGIVRQYIITENELKGIASQIIGKDRVFAIGVAFFESKQNSTVCNKLNHQMLSHGSYSSSTSSSNIFNYAGKNNILHEFSFNKLSSNPQPLQDSSEDIQCYSRGMSLGGASAANASEELLIGSNDSINDSDDDTYKTEVPTNSKINVTKSYEVGAGSKIDQKLTDDSFSLDYWNESPSAFIYINYCDVEDANRIIKAGKRQLKNEGFLAEVNKGN